jgi:ABC-2 type transport system ATP-binding protein
MIKITNLNKSYGDKKVLENLNCTIKTGSVYGLIGANGAGKSTLLRIIMGIFKKDSGIIEIDGKELVDSEELKQKLVYVPDDLFFFKNYTIKDMAIFYSKLYPKFDMDFAMGFAEKLKLNTNQKIQTFSKGMKRQVFIALALAVKPKYLLLDEAFDGLDPLSRKIFKDAIITLVEESQTTVLISSHSLRELEDFCDRFILIDSNTIKTQGDIAEHVGRYCKFELAFTEEVSKDIFAKFPIVSLTVKNRFVQIVLEGNSDDMREQLELLSPAVMDEMPLDFEETFIHDVRKDGMIQ